MAKKACLFCDKEADSLEHLWPHWILRRLGMKPIRQKFGKRPAKVIPHSWLEIRCVCEKDCNNGWMADLEKENVPIIGEMMENRSLTLDEAQQPSLVAWAMKTA